LKEIKSVAGINNKGGDSSLKRIGNFIKEARLSKNQSIEELASDLKIGAHQLKAIEEVNEEKLPEKVFIKAMIRRISQKLKLDTEFLMDEFKTERKEVKIEEIVEEVSKKNDLQTPQYDLTTEVLAQQQQINNLEETVTHHPAHRFGDSKKLKKYRKRIIDVVQEINIRKKLLEDKENHNWRTFTDLIQILNHFGCLNDLELTEIGQTVGAIRSENELWIGLVLVSGYLDDLDPPELAAIIQAICVDVRRPNLWCNFKPSLKVIDVFNELDGLRKLVSFQQNKFHIQIPIYLETELTGIISEWARGKKWKDLVFNTSLDEGDVVRIIRRSIDVLSQVQYCIGVSNKLKSKAKLALKAINRFPVSESNDLIKVSEDINPATKRIDNNF